MVAPSPSAHLDLDLRHIISTLLHPMLPFKPFERYIPPHLTPRVPCYTRLQAKHMRTCAQTTSLCHWHDCYVLLACRVDRDLKGYTVLVSGRLCTSAHIAENELPQCFNKRAFE